VCAEEDRITRKESLENLVQARAFKRSEKRSSSWRRSLTGKWKYPFRVKKGGYAVQGSSPLTHLPVREGGKVEGWGGVCQGMGDKENVYGTNVSSGLTRRSHIGRKTSDAQRPRGLDQDRKESRVYERREDTKKVQ